MVNDRVKLHSDSIYIDNIRCFYDFDGYLIFNRNKESLINKINILIFNCKICTQGVRSLIVGPGLSQVIVPRSFEVVQKLCHPLFVY